MCHDSKSFPIKIIEVYDKNMNRASYRFAMHARLNMSASTLFEDDILIRKQCIRFESTASVPCGITKKSYIITTTGKCYVWASYHNNTQV